MKNKKETNDFINEEEILNEDNFAEEIKESAEAEQAVSDSIDELKSKVDDLNDKNLRLMAEFDNYRKRSLKERSELIKTAGESILVSMLPLVDDFERALKAMETSTDVDAVKEGVELIYEKFVSFLSQNGVKEIPTENEPFDMDVHEAVTTFPAPSDDMKGKIMDCVSKGYTLNDKVIRYPKVVVCE
ncbi:nucleotide exchange factor GrpE [Paludibacter sp. 221]|uniref:nucleotide exchange factor GrpE n=1 Tax=Paludibacter sp. 221 TaxID=2302939 RepID=UPI0013D30518|nr:nucleotide exchange factor GrpE [Paludibacter sp. 221]NDV47590.1 nucleotide exchange factor GrpE [Paludibacter sp. 221]